MYKVLDYCKCTQHVTGINMDTIFSADKVTPQQQQLEIDTA